MSETPEQWLGLALWGLGTLGVGLTVIGYSDWFAALGILLFVGMALAASYHSP